MVTWNEDADSIILVDSCKTYNITIIIMKVGFWVRFKFHRKKNKIAFTFDKGFFNLAL